MQMGFKVLLFQLKIALSLNVIDELTEKHFYMIYRLKYKIIYHVNHDNHVMTEHIMVKIWIK